MQKKGEGQYWRQLAARPIGPPFDIKCVMFDDHPMRTTLDLDEDVLAAAKALASVQNRTAGQVLSELARRGLAAGRTRMRVRNGVPLLPSTPGRIVTPQMVDDALDEP
jgi:hypothetical protein